MDAVIRLGAACVMTAASAWGGRMLAAAQGRRVTALRDILEGVRRLGVEMMDRRLPLQEALAGCGAGIFAETARHMAAGKPPKEAYDASAQKLTERGGALDSLEEGDMAALGRLFAGLGEGGVAAQRLILDEAAEEVERLLAAARHKREEHGKLYTSLGALTGIALALMLL